MLAWETACDLLCEAQRARGNAKHFRGALIKASRGFPLGAFLPDLHALDHDDI